MDEDLLTGGAGPMLETERLRLMRPDEEDRAAIATLADNARIAENTSRMPYPYRVTDAQNWLAELAARAQDEIVFGIFLRRSARHFIGAVGIRRLEEAEPELGYWLGEGHWNQGFATEAAHATIDFAFNRLGHGRLFAGCRVTNRNGRRVLEKCGFQYCGDAMMPSRFFSGSVPIRRYRLERSVWAGLKSWPAASLHVNGLSGIGSNG